jgi:hypothetical protein
MSIYNLEHMPTFEDYNKNNSWTVVITKIKTEWIPEKHKERFLVMESIKEIHGTRLFPHLKLWDLKRIVLDIKRVNEETPDATTVLHPSQILAIHQTFDKAREIQIRLQDYLGFKVTIFPTSIIQFNKPKGEENNE